MINPDALEAGPYLKKSLFSNMSVREVSRMEASPIPTGRSAKQRAGLAFRASPALCFAVYAPGSMLLVLKGMEDVRSMDVVIAIVMVVIAVIAIVMVAMSKAAAAV